MAAVFDAYVMVDWSASAVPQTGADSVWVAVHERAENGGFRPLRLVNPPTRRAAMDLLADLLSDLVARDLTALVGFDFAFGYPAGFAAQIDPQRADWKGVWRAIAARIRDDETNANNRFAVAAELNGRISRENFPFWGCPPGEVRPTLTTTRPSRFALAKSDQAVDGLAEFRLTDRAATGPHPVWKLAYPGSVGSQTLLGIAHLEALRRHPWLNGAVRIWPFETGLNPLCRPSGEGWRLIFAEIYPSMLDVRPGLGEVKDAAQVRTVVDHLSRLDDEGRLADLFAGPPGLTPEQRRAIEREEAWILGIETTARARPLALVPMPSRQTVGVYDYVRDPAEIYRRSFAAIRAEANLDRLPPDLAVLAARIIHAAGDAEIVADLVASADAVAVARAALRAGAAILVDSEMVAAGIIRSRLPRDNRVICTLKDAQAEVARARTMTRSAAAVELWAPQLEGAVVAIGNAPTALFRLLELLHAGAVPPAVILGFPVGFVGAAEAKQALIENTLGVPFIALRGRRGGSAMAAAAVNALAGDDA